MNKQTKYINTIDEFIDNTTYSGVIECARIVANDFTPSKSFKDNNFDDLDGIEFIMEVEKKFNLNVNDSLAENIVFSKLILGEIYSKVRNEKIEYLMNYIK